MKNVSEFISRLIRMAYVTEDAGRALDKRLSEMLISWDIQASEIDRLIKDVVNSDVSAVILHESYLQGAFLQKAPELAADMACIEAKRIVSGRKHPDPDHILSRRIYTIYMMLNDLYSFERAT